MDTRGVWEDLMKPAHISIFKQEHHNSIIILLSESWELKVVEQHIELTLFRLKRW